MRDLAQRHRGDIEARWPKVLRRVGGYSLDIFHPQSEKPYTDDGSVNLAHLLVGAEGTLAWSRTLTLKLAPLPGAKVLGVVNFPTFRAAMAAAQHIVELGPTAVELVDRTMIDLALANPAFRPTMEPALIGEPAAILLVEFAARERRAAARLEDLVELMGDLGLPGSVVEMVDDGAQKELWEVRKAGLNIMMSLKGDGKPVSFIEDCAVPLEHLADYTDALTEVFTRHGTRGTWYAHASVGTLHVRPILDMRRDGAPRRCAPSPRKRRALVRKYKGAYSGEHGDGLCRGEWIAWQFGPALTDAFRRDQEACSIRIGLFSPEAGSSIRRRWTTARCSASRRRRAAPYRTIALDAGARLVGVERAERSAHRGRQRARQRRRQHRRPRQGGRDVQQQRPLPQVRRRHDVPELSRHARRAAPDARSRQHAAPGALGPARPKTPSRARRCTRRWICASAARAASASARPASTWRA